MQSHNKALAQPLAGSEHSENGTFHIILGVEPRPAILPFPTVTARMLSNTQGTCSRAYTDQMSQSWEVPLVRAQGSVNFGRVIMEQLPKG